MLRVLLEERGDEPVKLRGDAVADLAEARRCLLKVAAHHCVLGGRIKHGAAGEEFIGDAADRVQVGLVGYIACVCLLGGHVSGSADHHARCGQAGCPGFLHCRYGGLLALTRPLRLFVTTPGRAELRLEKKLRGLHIQAQMWPEYDAYDLLVPLPDGQVWAVDVKDWANPALLGRHIKPLPETPRYDKAFVVVPDHRLRRRANYLDVVIRNMRRTVASKLVLMSERQFTAAVRDAVTRHDGREADGHETTEDDDA